MHPNALILSLAALASVAVSTKDNDNGPRCAEDEYYNTMMKSKNRKSAVTDCAKWLGGTFTGPKEIPKYLKDCGRDKDEDRVSRVSAACYCIATSSVPATLSPPRHVSSTQSSTAIITTSSIPRSHPLSSSSASADILYCSTLINHIENYPKPIQYIPKPFQSSIVDTFQLHEHDIIRQWATHHDHKSFEYRPDADNKVADNRVSVNKHSTHGQPIVLWNDCKYSDDTKSIYTVTSCVPGKPNCPAASTALVTSTIAISTTICPVTETPRPSLPQPEEQRTPRWMTTTIYSATTYTLTRCPPGATNCPVGNLPITTRVPVSTTVLHVGQTPTQNGGSNKSHGKPDPASTTFTVVTVPTTIQTVMNGVTAQILTVVPVTSAIAVENSGVAVPTPSSTADANPHAGIAQPSSPGPGNNSGTGAGPVAPSHPHASATDAPYDAAAREPTEPSRSGLTFKPNLPAADVTTVKAPTTSSRPPVVTAGAPGMVGSDGMRAAFLVFVIAALL